MKELVYVKEMGVEKVGVTNSRLIAEEFGKEHKDVLTEIESVISHAAIHEDICALFPISKWEKGEAQEYEIIEQGFTLLLALNPSLVGDTTKIRFINAFCSADYELQNQRADTFMELIAIYQDTISYMKDSIETLGKTLPKFEDLPEIVKEELTLSLDEKVKRDGASYRKAKEEYDRKNPKYFYVFSTSNGACKIGVSSQIQHRWNTLASSGGFVIEESAIYQCTNPFHVETWMKRMFDGVKIKGEYFDVGFGRLKEVLLKYPHEVLKEVKK